MTNGEWLDYLAHNAPDELAAWFDAEHTESPTSETMQQIGQVIESTVKRGVYGDTESENADSRDKIEADVRDTVPEWHVDKVVGWLDRQAAITKRETLHDNPMCSGRSTCSANDEIRDVDIWNVAYEIYCAGGYVDNGNEPNPPTDGIRKLLDRQAEITREEADAGCKECFTERHKRERELGEAIDGLTDQVGLERRKAIELTNAINELQKKQPYCYNPEQPLDSLNTIGRYIDELKTRSRDLVNDLVRVRDERNNLKLNNLQLHTLAGEQAATIDWLTAERDNLKDDLIDERGKLNRKMNALREVTRDYRNERDHYREKFGKCLDYADAIHALMDDEGLA